MALSLILIGAILVIAAARNSQGDLFALIKGDLIGPNSFTAWAIGLLLVGAIGYIPRLRPVSVAFLALILIAIVVRKGNGLFALLTKAEETKGTS